MKFIFNISCTNTHNQNKYILTKKNKQKTIIISNFKFYTKYKRKKKKNPICREKYKIIFAKQTFDIMDSKY